MIARDPREQLSAFAAAPRELQLTVPHCSTALLGR